MTDNTIVLAGLKRKQREILGAIRAYEAQIVQAKHDLAHINATIGLMDKATAKQRAYIAGRGFFDKGEIAGIAARILSDGPMTTREIAESVMIEKDMDPSDSALRNSVVYKTVQALRHAKRRKAVVMLEKRGGQCVWATT
ncbi:hypothetical protein [Fulvimarina sp. MAC8]|uniref:hypothetical protein n=1 Tax=Fulvimarina sp. MAC8 TaxID=3162874 RepID=UPI0032EBA3E7